MVLVQKPPTKIIDTKKNSDTVKTIQSTPSQSYTGGGTVNGVSFNNVSNNSPSGLSQDYGQVAYLGNQTNQNYQYSGAGVGSGAGIDNRNVGLIGNAQANTLGLGGGSGVVNDFEYLSKNGIRPVNLTVEQERNYNEYRNYAQNEAFDLYHAGGDLSGLSNYQQGIIKGYEEQIEYNRQERANIMAERQLMEQQQAQSQPGPGVQFGDRGQAVAFGNQASAPQVLNAPQQQFQGASTNIPSQSQGQYNPQNHQALLSNAQQLGRSYGFNDQMLGWISQAAEEGRPMHDATPEKQAVYDAYQQYLRSDIEAKARSGVQLAAPTEYKQNLYNQFLQSGQQVQQGDSRLQAMQDLLQQSANSQIQQQDALLKQALDRQLTDLQKSLNDAIAQGELSVREANQQFESAKQQIQQQAYTDSEYTRLVSQQRGISNSQQSLGLIQGDQSRTNSLINQNLTTRDQQINTITNQLNNIRNNTNLDIANANANYNYGLASATAGINANTANQQFQFQSQDYFAQQGQQFNRENLALQNQYDQSNLNLQQRFTLEQFAKQQGYDLEKLSVQQQNQLAILAQSYGYDLGLQNNSQQFQAGQNQLNRDFEANQSALTRNFQAGQNSLDRNLQASLQASRTASEIALLNERQRLEFARDDAEVQRKLAFYTPGTTEYKALQLESDFAFQQLVRENAANAAAEIGHTQLANVLSQYPTTQPNPSNKKASAEYDRQVQSLNKQLEKLLGADGQKYTRDLINSSGITPQSTSSESGGFTVNQLLKATPSQFNSTINRAINLLK